MQRLVFHCSKFWNLIQTNTYQTPPQLVAATGARENGRLTAFYVRDIMLNRY